MEMEQVPWVTALGEEEEEVSVVVINMPGYMNNTIPRRGIGYFMRDPYWRGFHGYYPHYEYNTNAEPREFTKDEQKKILEAELKDIEMEKENIEKRLKELE